MYKRIMELESMNIEFNRKWLQRDTDPLYQLILKYDFEWLKTLKNKEIPECWSMFIRNYEGCPRPDWNVDNE